MEASDRTEAESMEALDSTVAPDSTVVGIQSVGTEADRRLEDTAAEGTVSAGKAEEGTPVVSEDTVSVGKEEGDIQVVSAGTEAADTQEVLYKSEALLLVETL